MDRFAAEERADPLLLRVPDADDPARLRQRNRDELAASLFPGRSPTSLPVTSPEWVRWADPQRGLVFEFRFASDGTWSTYRLAPPDLDQPWPQPRPPWLLRAHRNIDPYRRIWVGWRTPFTVGPMLWIALVFGSIFWSRAAFPLAHAHAVVAWLCFMGWLLNPNYSITLHGIFSNPMLAWGAAMVIISWVLLWLVAARTAMIDPARCRACGYDLTGNVSGVCPECGTSVNEGTEAAATASP